MYSIYVLTLNLAIKHIWEIIRLIQTTPEINYISRWMSKSWKTSACCHLWRKKPNFYKVMTNEVSYHNMRFIFLMRIAFTSYSQPFIKMQWVFFIRLHSFIISLIRTFSNENMQLPLNLASFLSPKIDWRPFIQPHHRAIHDLRLRITLPLCASFIS